MTVVLSIMCADGVVIAADSQITDSNRGMSFPGQKLHHLGDHAAWGGSGARGVLTDIEKALDAAAEEVLAADEVSHALQELALPILRRHYDMFISDIPGEDTQGTPSAYLLAAGYSKGEPFIVEINPNGMVSRYEDIGFHAIGSGAPQAQQAGALLAHFRMVERPVDYGVLGAVRVIEALSVTSPSVGLEIDVARITPEGAHHLEEEEIDAVREDVKRWIKAEHELLDGLLD
ncbi:MAG TPA: proteasome protein [Gammaproteobacteria bacterium]|nr:proteasome protein [Gammaproteobacteria bacterium]